MPPLSQRRRLRKLGARTIARVVMVKRGPDDDGVTHWQRMHSVGHSLLQAHGGVDVQRLRRIHGFAGQLARAPDDILHTALRTRSLSWWRAFQSKRLLKHPKRFSAWRWEQPLEDHYGPAASMFIDEDVGWRAVALDRGEWKAQTNSFVERNTNEVV